jgi:hypothetical protein
MNDYAQWVKRAETAEAEVIRLTLVLGAKTTEVERIWIEENDSLKAELRRLYGQFRLALRNGEKLLIDGVEDER